VVKYRQGNLSEEEVSQGELINPSPEEIQVRIDNYQVGTSQMATERTPLLRTQVEVLPKLNK